MNFYNSQKGVSIPAIIIFVVLGLVLLAGGYLAGHYLPIFNVGDELIEDVNTNVALVDEEPGIEEVVPEILLDNPVDNFVLRGEKVLVIEGQGPAGAKMVATIRNSDQSTTEWAEQQMIEGERDFSFTISVEHILPGAVRLQLRARDIEGKLLVEKDVMGEREEVDIEEEEEWSIYENTNYGYSLLYPKDFTLQVVDSRDGSENPIGYRSVFWSRDNFKDYLIPESDGMKEGIFYLAVEYRDKSQAYIDHETVVKAENIKVNGYSGAKYYLETSFGDLIKVYVKTSEGTYGITLAEKDDEQKEVSKKFLESIEFTVVAEEPEDETADWFVYTNSEVGYSIKYPKGAHELKDANKQCVSLAYEYGYVMIRSSETEEICGRTGFGYEAVPKSETLTIDGKTYLASGNEQKGPGETLDYHNETLVVTLDGGTRIEYGAQQKPGQPEATFADYLEMRETLLKIVQTYQSSK